MLALFRDNDILLALATPYPAPFIGQEMIENDGAMVPARSRASMSRSVPSSEAKSRSCAIPSASTRTSGRAKSVMGNS